MNMEEVYNSINKQFHKQIEYDQEMPQSQTTN